MNIITKFDKFLNEEEDAQEVAQSIDTPAPETPKEEDEGKDETHKKFRVKEERIGYTPDSKEVIAKIKLGHTIELTPDDLKTLSNMKVTQYESDMFEHTRGGKEYKIKKDSSGKFTIFHYHKTLHKLTPIGTFRIS